MKLTAQDLEGMGVIDEIIPEPLGGAHHDHIAIGRSVKSALIKHLTELREIDGDELLNQRYEKFRKFGEFRG